MKKGQAAMEFLMTYGWAILVVLVAIAALAYFGVLNPSKFLPESCTIGPGISCEEFQVNATGGAAVIVRNGMGEAMTGVSMTLGGVSSGVPVSIADGATANFLFTVTAGTAGSKYSAPLAMTYSTGTIVHTKTGKLTTKYE